MARQLTAAELGKAARNLKRIESFLSARCEWSLDAVGKLSFGTLKVAVDTLAFTIAQRTLALGIDAKLTPSGPAVQVSKEVFDAALLGRFATFIGELDQWFVAHSDAVPESGAGRILAGIQGSLETMRRALTTIEKHQESNAPSAQETDEEAAAELPADAPIEPAEDAAAAGDAGPEPAPPPVRAPTSAVDDIYAGTRGGAGKAPAKPPELIAFTASDVDPMYTWVGPETVDLTPLARQRIEKLFEEQGVAFFRYQLENFNDEIRKRIENAPEGHVLVVKVRSIGDERKPFLSYIAETALHEHRR